MKRSDSSRLFRESGARTERFGRDVVPFWRMQYVGASMLRTLVRSISLVAILAGTAAAEDPMPAETGAAEAEAAEAEAAEAEDQPNGQSAGHLARKVPNRHPGQAR